MGPNDPRVMLVLLVPTYKGVHILVIIEVVGLWPVYRPTVSVPVSSLVYLLLFCLCLPLSVGLVCLFLFRRSDLSVPLSPYTIVVE